MLKFINDRESENPEDWNSNTSHVKVYHRGVEGTHTV